VQGAGSHLVVRLHAGVNESRFAKMAAANGIEVPLVSDYGNARGLILGYGSTDAKSDSQRDVRARRGDQSRASSLACAS